MSVLDAPARPRRLRDHRGAVGVDLRDRVRQIPRVGERPPVAAVVAAETLAGALEQVTDEDARGEPVPVVPRPAVLVRERREEQRRVGDPAGDHDVGALRERVGDRARAEVRGCEQRRRGERVERCRRCRGARTIAPSACNASSRGSRSSPTTVAIVMPVTPSAWAVSMAARAAAAGLIPPALVMTFVRPSATNGSARVEVRGKVARVAARLVALPVLLQDRERQLRQCLEAQVVDAIGEEGVRRPTGCRRRTLGRRRQKPEGEPNVQPRRVGSTITRRRAAAARPRAARPRLVPRPARAGPRGTAPRPTARRSAATDPTSRSAARWPADR